MVREEELRTVAMKCVGRGVLVVVSVVVVFNRPLRMAMPIFPVVGLLVGLMDGHVCRVEKVGCTAAENGEGVFWCRHGGCGCGYWFDSVG